LYVKVVLGSQTPGCPRQHRKRERHEISIAIERSMLAVVVVEAENMKQAEIQAVSDFARRRL
jgi:hypothetical protein